MSIEIWQSDQTIEATRTNKDGSARLTYWVRGTDDMDLVITTVADEAPVAQPIGGDWVIRAKIDPRRRGPSIWEVAVGYVDETDPRADDPDAQTWGFSFDTTAGQTEILQSLSTSGIYYREGFNPAQDLKGAIGWDGKKLAGTKIFVPKLEFTIEMDYHPSIVTPRFAAQLARATATVNNDETWLGFKGGEVLFAGAQGRGDRPTKRGQRTKPTKISFKFLCSENRYDLVIGDIAAKLSGRDMGGAGVNEITKLGWEYLWIYYTKKDAAGVVFPTPEWVYVEKVYREMSFCRFFGVR